MIEDHGEPIRPGQPVGPLLVIMVGPTGAGKTRWIKRYLERWQAEEPIGFDATMVVSSDSIRANLCGDFRSQTRNRDVFKAAQRLIQVRMNCGLMTIYDATNLDQQVRVELVARVPEMATAVYVVVDRPLPDKLLTRGWRDAKLIERFHEKFQAELPTIMAGDGLENVAVIIANEGSDLYVHT